VTHFGGGECCRDHAHDRGRVHCVLGKAVVPCSLLATDRSLGVDTQVAETSLHVSGVLSVVVLGYTSDCRNNRVLSVAEFLEFLLCRLYLSNQRESISPGVQQSMTHVWGMIR
jgi:hypothetical protein